MNLDSDSSTVSIVEVPTALTEAAEHNDDLLRQSQEFEEENDSAILIAKAYERTQARLQELDKEADELEESL